MAATEDDAPTGVNVAAPEGACAGKGVAAGVGVAAMKDAVLYMAATGTFVKKAKDALEAKEDKTESADDPCKSRHPRDVVFVTGSPQTPTWKRR